MIKKCDITLADAVLSGLLAGVVFFLCNPGMLLGEDYVNGTCTASSNGCCPSSGCQHFLGLRCDDQSVNIRSVHYTDAAYNYCELNGQCNETGAFQCCEKIYYREQNCAGEEACTEHETQNECVSAGS